ncbi:hypothetical protein [Microscilla marina]|uniref:Uncharacterized protein n=1 Tax=Microscilla marina ATCC 23134 TaxID=313606 RepID=A1ZUM2_MICM2|nr:hypothetical protein [Microscilla marina]EAY25908.1 hypothetical protein M23134_00862 [Microscilla marina ATCC 23134]
MDTTTIEDDLLGFFGGFALGTQVLMADNSWKNIECLKPGDEVMSLSGHAEVIQLVDLTNKVQQQLYYLDGDPSLTFAGSQLFISSKQHIGHQEEFLCAEPHHIASRRLKAVGVGFIEGGAMVTHQGKNRIPVHVDKLQAKDSQQLTPVFHVMVDRNDTIVVGKNQRFAALSLAPKLLDYTTRIGKKLYAIIANYEADAAHITNKLTFEQLLGMSQSLKAQDGQEVLFAGELTPQTIPNATQKLGFAARYLYAYLLTNHLAQLEQIASMGWRIFTQYWNRNHRMVIALSLHSIEWRPSYIPLENVQVSSALSSYLKVGQSWEQLLLSGKEQPLVGLMKKSQYFVTEKKMDGLRVANWVYQIELAEDDQNLKGELHFPDALDVPYFQSRCGLEDEQGQQQATLLFDVRFITEEIMLAEQEAHKNYDETKQGDFEDAFLTKWMNNIFKAVEEQTSSLATAATFSKPSVMSVKS